MSKIFQELDGLTISVVRMLPETPGLGSSGNSGSPRLRKIFNFASREVITMYERGGNSSNGYSAMAATMDIRNFENIEGKDEIKEAYAELKKRSNKLASLEEYLSPPNSIRKLQK